MRNYFYKEVIIIEIELNVKEISNRLKNKLKELNIKQTDLVEITGISKTAISNYVLGNRIPDTKSTLLIAKALNTSIEWLLIGKETINLTQDEINLLEKYNLLTDKNKGKTENFIDERIAEQENFYESNKKA